MKISCCSLILGKGYTLDAAVETLSRLGYDGIEWRVRDDFHLPLVNLEEKAEEIKALCANAGLQIPILSTYLPVEEAAAISGVVKAAATLGCPMVRVIPPRYDGSRAYHDLLEETRRNLAELETPCRQAKVKILVELHLGYIIPSASSTLRLLEGFSPEWVGAIFDPGNMVCEGFENWKMGLQILGPYLAHVHVKNAGWYYSKEQGWSSLWSPMEDGIVQWEEIISLLREADYDGWLSLEDFTETSMVEELLEKDLALLRGYLTEEQAS